MIAEHYLGKLSGRVQQVTVAKSLQGMREQLGASQVDVVLLDLTLPDSPMKETLAALRSLTAEHSAKFVVMSSLGLDDIARNALEEGAHAFLPKQDLNADSLRQILDEVDPVQPSDQEHEAEPSSVAAAAYSTAQSTAQSTVQSTAPTPGHPAAITAGTLEPLDGKTLLTKIAHDALGWVANIAFRASHLAADPAVKGSEELMADVASLRLSAEALTSFISGSRSLIQAELAEGVDHGHESIELGSWLEACTARWKKTTRDKRLTFEVSATSTVQVNGKAGTRALSQCLAALFQNAQTHSRRKEGEIHVTIREEATSGTHVTVVVTDDGGPWQMARGERLGTPLARGEHSPASAGLGLFNARRSLESTGGALSFVERSDVPGAFGIRLSLPRG